MCVCAQSIRVTDLPTDPGQCAVYLRNRIEEYATHLKIAEALAVCLEHEEEEIVKRYDATDGVSLPAPEQGEAGE